MYSIVWTNISALLFSGLFSIFFGKIFFHTIQYSKEYARVPHSYLCAAVDSGIKGDY